jgi:signal transduction histidine kinase
MTDEPASNEVRTDQAATLVYRIGEMAQQTGLTVRAIRLYEEEGLLRPSQHVRGANRLYNATDLERLKQIAGMRNVGFSIAEIRDLLEDDALRRQLQVRYQKATDPTERRRLIAQTMTLSEQLIAALERRRARVQALMLMAESRRRQEAEGEARAAQEDERRRIAEDVHDDVVQVMTAVAVRLGLLRRRLQDPGQLAVADGAEATVEQAIVRLRALIFDLSPPTLDRYGLAAAVRMKLEQFETEVGFECQLQAEVDTEPEPAVRVLIYRVIQEALSNVRKHAHASKVVISISEDDAGVLVRIRDDGVGFSAADATAAKGGHLGFRTMRERAQGAGGWLKAESTSGVGSTISLWVPNRPQGPRSMEPARPEEMAAL